MMLRALLLVALLLPFAGGRAMAHALEPGFLELQPLGVERLPTDLHR